MFQILLSKGLKKVILEDLSFADQVQIFASADVIVSPHGAGLSNLVFCRPDTKVLEFFSPNYVNVCFWVLSNHVGADYYCFIGDGLVLPETSIEHGIENNITVSI